MYFVCERPDKFLPEVTEALTAFEDQLIDEQGKVEATSNALFDSGHDELALAYLTEHTNNSAKSALELGKALLWSIQTRTRILYGLRAPEGDETSRLDYEMVTCR